MPKVVVFAGINGSGKTSSSADILNRVHGVKTFVNADTIARGLGAYDVERWAIKAGRIMLEHLDELGNEGLDFAIETTLAAKTYVSRLKGLRDRGYEVHLYYYWLNHPDLAVARVAARVKSGGHDIPEETIRRRYALTIKNFLTLYRPICDYWEILDNSNGKRRMLACGDSKEQLVESETVWQQFIRSADHV